MSTVPAFAAAASLMLAVAPTAGAATSGAGLYVRGAGDGHGVGMSQYGAAGFALHGASYQEILHNYYAGTTLGHVDPNKTVTVLLRSSGSAVFSGASTIRGATTSKGAKLTLNPLWNYSVFPAGPRLRVMLGRRLIGRFNAPMQVAGPAPLKLAGLGSYRGTFVFRPSPHGGVMTVNAVGLDDYVRGVVAAEMPPGWPAQALAAQAVAARSYAVTSRPIGAEFDVYDNTRSQEYLGVKAETASSDAAVAATSGQVVEYAGAPVVTYFFASSGGETESDQNVFPIAPSAWLVGRPDPYDDAFNDPYHRWHLTFGLKAAEKRLGGLVEGSLIGIKVLQRGVSPRIITAKVVGTKGSVRVTGLQLRKALGAPSTWMSFTTVSSHGVQTSTTPAATTTLPAPVTTTSSTGTDTTTTPGSGGGGLIRHAQGRRTALAHARANPRAEERRGARAEERRSARAEERRSARAEPEGGLYLEFERTSSFIARLFAALRIPTTSYRVSGTVFPAAPGSQLTVQRLAGARWRSVASGRVGVGGRYSVGVDGRGVYRVRFHGTTGPAITVR